MAKEQGDSLSEIVKAATASAEDRQRLFEGKTLINKDVFQQIQRGPQIEVSGNRSAIQSPEEYESNVRQPRVDRDESVQIQDGNLLASMNLLEIKHMKPLPIAE